MEFPSSQPTEFFDAPENKLAGPSLQTEESDPDQNQDMRQSDSESLYHHGYSPLRSPTLLLINQLLHMQPLPPSNEKSYVSLSALIENVNKCSLSRILCGQKRGNRKDKNGDLKRICLRCSKGKIL